LFRRSTAWVAVAAFLAGSLPFWVYNVENRFATFRLLTHEAALSGSAGRGADLYWVLARGLPAVLGVREFDGAFAYGALGLALAALALGGTVAALVNLRASWIELACGRVARARPAACLFLFVAVTAVIYTECRPTTLRLERYLVPFASATIPLTAMAIDWLLARRRALGALLLVSLLGLYAREVVDLHWRFGGTPVRFFCGRVDELSRYLVRSPIRFAYAEYGDAMITTFLARDRVVVTDYQNRRYPIDEEKVENPAIILYDERDGGAEGTLQSLDTEYERTRVAGYRIYWPIHYDGVPRSPLRREGWKTWATTDAEDVELILDGDPLTRWSAAASASSHPALTLDLGRSETVSGIYLALGGQPVTAFRRLLVETSSDAQRWELAKEASWDFPISFRPDGQVSVMPDDVQMVLFTPRSARWLRLTLLETFPGQIWTVAELDVFGQAPAGPIFQPPVLADPSSFEVAEHRLRHEMDRHPETDAALRELRELYRRHSDMEHVTALDQVQAEHFSPTVSLGWRFGEALELAGYDRNTLGPRDLEITYYWKARRRMDADYAAFVHVKGAQGNFQADYVLGSVGHFTRSWQPGEIVKQTERLSLPQQLPAGAYEVALGVWDPADHHHLLFGPWWHPSKTALLFASLGVSQPAEFAPSHRSRDGSAGELGDPHFREAFLVGREHSQIDFHGLE
jgi:hypothetical protein